MNNSCLKYSIDFAQAGRHLALVQLSIPMSDRAGVELVFPVWTPGSYMLREYTRNIQSIAAWTSDQPGSLLTTPDSRQAVHLHRDGKNRWYVEPKQATAWLIIEYPLYCRENTVRTNWLDADYGFITGAATFPFVDGRSQEPIELEFRLHSNWSAAATALGPRSQKNFPDTHLVQYLADNYDQLIDSPIVFGNFDARSFESANRQHQLVNVGGDQLWDLDRATADVHQIVDEHHKFWKEIPYPHYWFLNLCTQATGGLEHDNSTVLMCNRFAMQQRESYVNWLSLVSHEFFHTWNIRRLRPRGLLRYDYESEHFFAELWIAEGITSYYDKLLLVRSGCCSVEEFLSRLSETIASVQNSPGRLIQDLYNASWDAWVKHYRPDENSQNARISYYLKGSLVAWLLDARLRANSGNQVSLDDAVRKLWTDYRTEGYTHADFSEIIEDLGSPAIRRWLDETIQFATELDFGPALQQFGLRFKPTVPSSTTIDPKLWLGCETVWIEGKLQVRRVTRDSAAELAGINVDDEFIAIQGYRFSVDNWKDLLSCFPEGSLLELLVARREKLRSLALTIPQKISYSWQLEVDPDNRSVAASSWLESCSGRSEL